MSVLEIAEEQPPVDNGEQNDTSEHQDRDGRRVAELAVAEGRLVYDHSQCQPASFSTAEGTRPSASNAAQQHQRGVKQLDAADNGDADDEEADALQQWQSDPKEHLPIIGSVNSRRFKDLA